VADRANQKVPDLVKRDFTAPAPNAKYVGDITYLPLTTGSNLYLATVIDCFSGRVAGWAIAGHMRTVQDSGRHPVHGRDRVKCLNALAESFNATLKREILQDRSQWLDAAICRREVFRWLVRYNLTRRHSRCAYSSPAAYEEKHTSHYAARSGVTTNPVSTIRDQGPPESRDVLWVWLPSLIGY
jgi:transposase InsO family protein